MSHSSQEAPAAACLPLDAEAAIDYCCAHVDQEAQDWAA